VLQYVLQCRDQSLAQVAVRITVCVAVCVAVRVAVCVAVRVAECVILSAHA